MIPSWTRFQRTQIVPKLLDMEVVSPLYGHPFSDYGSMSLYLWHGMAWYIELSRWGVYIGLHISLMWFYYQLLEVPKVQSDSIALTIYQYIYYSFSACYKFVATLSYLRVQYIMFRLYHWFIACLVMYYFSFILSCMLSTFQVLTHTFATSSPNVGSGSHHSYHT